MDKIKCPVCEEFGKVSHCNKSPIYYAQTLQKPFTYHDEDGVKHKHGKSVRKI
jgi:hypothetical protein